MYFSSVLIYGINAILEFFLIHLAIKFENKRVKYNFFIFLAILIPSILGGIRYGIGTDYFIRYLPDFKIIKNNIWADTKVEFGFEFISRIIVFLNLDFQFMLFFVQIITNSLILLSLLHYKKEISPALGMFIYMLLYYQCSYNIVRQSLAMAIIFFSLKYIEDKKFFKFIICCFIATSIHTSAIIIIPIYFLYNIWSEKKYIYPYLKYFIYIILLIVIFNFKNFFNLVSSILDLDYYQRYSDLGKIEEISWYFYIKWIIYLIPGTIIFFKYKNYCTKNILKQYNFFLSYTIFGAILSITSYTNSIALFRISYYFTIGLIYLLPKQCNSSHICIRIGNLKIKIFNFFIIAFLIVIWYYEYFIRGDSETVPYNCIFYMNN